MESGKPAATSDGVTYLRQEGNRAVYAVGAGDYTFTSDWLPSRPDGDG
jgi:hypothetical protein